VGINLKNELFIGQKVHVCATHVLDRWKYWKGVWSDYMILKKNEIILIPEDINDESAIQLFVNVITPLAMVKEMNLKKGDILLQTAANSVVGRVIIQLSKIYGFKTINIVRNKLAAINLCKTYNINEVYVYSNNNHEKLFSSLSNKYNNATIKYVIDAVSGNLGLLCWKLLSQNGVFYSYGALSGEHSLDINVVNDLCRNNKTLKGWSIQETWLRTKSNKEKLKIINEIWELFKKGQLNLPKLGKSFELEQFQEALIESQKPQKKGKITLRMS
jgi:NADPH:quinone reductase-like Zn-dependent oxidoreductase